MTAMRQSETALVLSAIAVAALLASAPAAAGAGAGKIYRCDGNVYQSERCDGGRQLDIDLDRNVVAAENRRPVVPPPSDDRERREVIVVREAPPPPAPEIITEPVYLWPPRFHSHSRSGTLPHFQQFRQFPHGMHRDTERPRPPRARQDVGRPAYGYRPTD